MTDATVADRLKRVKTLWKRLATLPDKAVDTKDYRDLVLAIRLEADIINKTTGHNLTLAIEKPNLKTRKKAR